MSQSVTLSIFSILSSLLLSSCMVGPNFKSPLGNVKDYNDLPLPTHTQASESQSGISQHFKKGYIVPLGWWHAFGSPHLNLLIEKGLEYNPTVKAAKAALISAEQNLKAQVGTTLIPNIDAQFNGTRQKYSGSNLGQTGFSGNIFNVFNATFNASYSLDLFGLNRRAIEALCRQVDFQRYELAATYLTLTTNIATTVIQEASLRAQLDATLELMQVQDRLLTILQKQFELGAVNKALVLAQETQAAQTRALVPPLEKNLAQTRHALSALIGELPSELSLPMFNLDEFVLPQQLPIEVPSTLLRNRPDIQASEALLNQAASLIGVATANMLPQININAQYGWQANQLGQLFKSSTNIWNITGQVLQPIFHGGALRAKRHQAVATFAQLQAQYEQTILNAFQNVADALRAVEVDAKALNSQTVALIAAKKSLVLSQGQYRLGGINFLTLLNAQQEYQTVVINQIKAQATRYIDNIALFQALGGGWNQAVNDRNIK